MRALPLLLAVPVGMWRSQSLLLWCGGQAMRWRIGAPDLPRSLERINRFVTNLTFAGVVLTYPLLRGESPWAYYAQFLPLGPRPIELLHGCGASILYLAALYLAWLISGNVRFEVRDDARRLVRHLVGVPLTAIFAAFVEELLFRAMLLAGLLEDFDAHIAVPIGVVVFAAAHYVRSVKRYWTFPGHLALGALFCLAFLYTGALWLPLGLHAGGIVVLMAVRPFIRYSGPAWLVGASIFPYAGVVGVSALAALTINMWISYGGAP